MIRRNLYVNRYTNKWNKNMDYCFFYNDIYLFNKYIWAFVDKIEDKINKLFNNDKNKLILVIIMRISVALIIIIIITFLTINMFRAILLILL